MSQCPSRKTSLLIGVATETVWDQQSLTIAIDRFVTEGGHDTSKLSVLACEQSDAIESSLKSVAVSTGLEFETCSAHWQQAMGKYIDKFHPELDGLPRKAAAITLYNSGRKKLQTSPRLLEVNGRQIAIALSRIKDLPLAEYRTHMVFCGIEPCIPETESKAFATRLRKLARTMGLNKGERRLKITRSQCCGACRSGSVSVIYENLQPGEMAVNNGCWIAHGDELSDEQWLAVFKAVDERRPLNQILAARYFVEKVVR